MGVVGAMTRTPDQLARDPERDYIARTIATIRNHRDADNCWPQWANVLADEIERLDALVAELQAQAEAKADVLPDDTVCPCLSETGQRKVRLYERCQRCGAFMEADDITLALAAAKLAAAAPSPADQEEA